MRNYVEEGQSLTLTAPYIVAPGAGMLVGNIFAVAKNPAAAGVPVDAMLRGVFAMAKAAGQAWTQGQMVYWDNTALNVTTTAAGNRIIGAASQAQAAGDTVGRVMLDGIAR